MAVDLRCPNCADNLGKDVENPRKAYCGNCGHSFPNRRGYTEGEEDVESASVKQSVVTGRCTSYDKKTTRRKT